MARAVVPAAIAAPAPRVAPPDDPEPGRGAVVVPAGYVELIVGGITNTPHGTAVILTDEVERIAIPIFVGPTEGLAIGLRFQNERYERPLTHDLLDSVLAELGGRVTSVRVDDLIEGVFCGTVLLERDGEVLHLDARASDAIALALGSRVPIHVARRVLERAAVDLESLPDEPAGEARDERPTPPIVSIPTDVSVDL